MSQTADGPSLIDKLRSFERTTAQGLSSMWGLVLDHLSEKHAKAAGSWAVEQEGGRPQTLRACVQLYLGKFSLTRKRRPRV